MQPSSIAPPETRSGVSRPKHCSQFNKYMTQLDSKVSFASSPSLASPSEEYFNPGFYPQTPTLSAPDTPTTAGPTSPGPSTPNTPSFGPLSPGYAYTKNEAGLNVPVPPQRALLLHGASKFGEQRVGASEDLHGVIEEDQDEGQELVIPEPRAALLPALQLHLSPPRSSTASASRLKVQESYASLTSTYTTGDVHQQNANPHKSEVFSAYKSDVLSPSTTTVDDSFETGMFEMLTPTQESGAFNYTEPALAERTRSILSPLAEDATPPRRTSRPADGSPPTSTASDNPSSNYSERPLVIRRHRPPPMSVSQDLSSLVRGFHMLHNFLRHRNPHAAPAPGSAPVYLTPPREDTSGRRGSRDRVVSEVREVNVDGPMTTPRSTSLPQTSTGRWLPSPGPDSPVRFFADSPAPLTPSPPPPGEFIRRHRPRSVRSISPIQLGDALMSQLESADSGVEGLHDGQERASELLFPLPPARGHRRQFAVSVSFRAFDGSDMNLGVGAGNSGSSSPGVLPIDSPQAQTEYRRRERLPDWATRPEIVRSEDHSSEIGGVSEKRGGEATQQTKETKRRFWKNLSTSASGLFARKAKAPSKQVADCEFESPAPKKRIIPSLSGLFRRREHMMRPNRSGAMLDVSRAHLEVWPTSHRRTSSCSDPTCLFHPQHPTASLAAMSFANSHSTTGFGYDLGDTEGTFLPDLGNWGHGGPTSARGFDTSPAESQCMSADGTSSSVREEGERNLQGILTISGSERVKESGSS